MSKPASSIPVGAVTQATSARSSATASVEAVSSKAASAGVSGGATTSAALQVTNNAGASAVTFNVVLFMAAGLLTGLIM
jgi:hypothetical protein